MSNLHEVWQSVKGMLNEGLSIIPVRDKQEGRYAAKTPYRKWESAQTERLTESVLWQQMQDTDTTAVAIVCGKVSGGLEVIDVDVKHKPGVGAELFSEIKSVRPDLFQKLRIHKTPSGGFHILYRIADGNPEGNQKLASRPKTEQEIEADKKRGVKKPQKQVCFIETRGESGYILAPPSLNYSVLQDLPIPLISWNDRCDIISICKGFNSIPEKQPYTKTKTESSAYIESPWEDFNKNGEISDILSESGWREHKYKGTNNKSIYYTRPASGSGGIHASFHTEKRTFYVFTTQSELESEKAHSPTSLLLELKFNGDKGQCYKWLVDNGYGKLKPRVEHRLAKSKAYSGGTLPANFSDQAKTAFEQLKTSIEKNMPYGIFWQEDPEKIGKYTISREDLYSVSDKLGFKMSDGNLVRISGAVIMNQEESDYYDCIKGYIWEEEAETYTAICNALEAFFQKSGKYTISRLRTVDKKLIMSDTRSHCYKFYQNGFLEITSTEITFKPYDAITGLVWEHKVQKRDYKNLKCKGVFTDFLTNAIGITDYHKRIIGYLSHDYKEESSGYIIVLVEKVPDPKDGGGSGKNVFGNMLRHTTTVKTVPGSQVKFDENFLQPWNHQRVYFLADIPKKIDWLFLKEMATGTGIHKRLYKDQVDVQSEDMPKLLLNTNYSYEETDGGLIRRIRHVEFTPFYTVNGGVDVVHGKMFPNDFTEEDWSDYDNFTAECIQLLLKSNGKIEKTDLSEDAWTKKFHMQYGDVTYTFISDYINLWKEQGFVSNKTFNEQYQNVCNDFDVPAKFRLSAKAMSNAIKEYCAKNGITCDTSAVRLVNGTSTRGKVFGENVQLLDDFPPF